MSRVECDHCGARYELSDENPAPESASASTTVTCRECGAPARSSASVKAASSDTLADPSSAEVDVETNPPDAETIPVPRSEPDSQDEPVTTRSPTVLRDVTDAAEDEEETIVRQPEPAALDIERIPVSGTPSIDMLIAARARRETTDSKPPVSRSVLEGPKYDLRPPDIQVDARPRLRSDAPVAGTQRPPAASQRSSSKLEILAALALFSAAGAFFTLRTMRNESASESSPPSAAQGPSPLEANAAEGPPVSEPAPMPQPGATEPTNAVMTTETAPAEPPAPPVSRPTRPKAPAVVPASLKAAPAEEPAPEEAPPAEAAFDASAAGDALEVTTKLASHCRKSSDPSGVATVTITFSPSGKVTTAQISGPPFAGTETGSCIASELRKTRVPAFTGDFVTVKKTLTIQ